MTFVLARAERGTVTVRADFLVTQRAEGTDEVTHWPLLKLLILDPSIVVGIAGSNGQGGVSNLLEAWANCETAAELRQAIHDDGTPDRHYLMATADGELSTWRGQHQGWAKSSYGRAWIGSPDAHSAHRPSPFDWKLSVQSPEVQRGATDWARRHGFTEDEIDAVTSGRVAEELEAELQFDQALAAGDPEVGGLVAEAHLVDGQFRYTQTSETRVLLGRPIRTEAEALASLATTAPTASYRMGMADDTYPAALRIEFTDTGAALTYRPGPDGYEKQWEAPRERAG